MFGIANGGWRGAALAEFLPCDSQETSEVLRDRGIKERAEHKGSGQSIKDLAGGGCAREWGGGSGKSNLEVEKEDAGNSLMVQGLVLRKGLIPPAPPPPADREGDAMGLAAS